MEFSDPSIVCFNASRIGLGLISLFSFWLRINQVDVKMYSHFRRAGQSALRGWAKMIHRNIDTWLEGRFEPAALCLKKQRPKSNVAGKCFNVQRTISLKDGPPIVGLTSALPSWRKSIGIDFLVDGFVRSGNICSFYEFIKCYKYKFVLGRTILV